MADKNTKFNNWNFVWAIIDTAVNIFVMVAVIILLAESIGKVFHGLLLLFMIAIFIAWSFRPMYLTFKEFIEKFPKKKPKKPLSKNTAFFIYFLLYFILFGISIIFFIKSVSFLGALVHPLILGFSFILSAVSIISYHHFSKREFKGPIWSFTKFFFIATIFLFISVVFFSSYGLSKGNNLEQIKVNFNAYIVNEALTEENALSALEYSKFVWNNYNIKISYDNLYNKEVDLTPEEVEYIFNNGSTQESCPAYLEIIHKITNESDKLSVIFLDNNGSKHAGRGCLCNCSFALVSQEKLGTFDFTGWNVAHEIGHIFGLSDIQYYGRVRQNLMNDETKKLLFIKSNFLDQYQVDIVINKTKGLNQQTLLNN